MERSLSKTSVEQEFELCLQDDFISWLEWANERVNITQQFSDDYTWLSRAMVTTTAA